MILPKYPNPITSPFMTLLEKNLFYKLYNSVLEFFLLKQRQANDNI